LDASNIFSTRLETSYSAAVDNRPNGRGKVQGLDTTATFLVTPNQWLSIGGGLNYGDGSKQFGVGQDAAGASVLGGSAHTSALLGFGLATVNLSRELSASFFAGYGKFSTSDTPPRAFRGSTTARQGFSAPGSPTSTRGKISSSFQVCKSASRR
jgi:hypothetical protein